MGIAFKGQPQNYRQIDRYVSRSAQPEKEDFKWLKEQGVTDVVNFRTMYVSGNDFDEKQIVEGVKQNNGKVHIHCKAGADRTGMYALIYKQKQHIGDFITNKLEMLEMGHHNDLYPHLLDWIEGFLSKKRGK